VILGVTGELEGIGEIARRARGTPRIANRLLRRVRDYAQVRGNGVITRPVTEEALKMLEVDPMGLDKMDTMLLVTMIDKFAGGPVEWRLGGGHRRGKGYHRGCLRAVSNSSGISSTDSEGASGDGLGLRPSRQNASNGKRRQAEDAAKFVQQVAEKEFHALTSSA
jgi:hypothetical protein